MRLCVTGGGVWREVARDAVASLKDRRGKKERTGTKRSCGAAVGRRGATSARCMHGTREMGKRNKEKEGSYVQPLSRVYTCERVACASCGDQREC